MEKIQYREETDTSKKYKEAYLNGIEQVIAAREESACKRRDRYVRNIFQEQERYRKDLSSMLGWPLTKVREHTLPPVKMEQLAEEKQCSVYRVSVEILEGCEMTGLLFRKSGDRCPLVIVQHGGEGTPEVISNFYGNTYNYNEMLERVFAQGVHVFAPQLLLWNKSEYKVGYDRIALDARLKRVGSSITAVEVYGIMRIIDYFEAQDYVSGFGMAGLSYGGFYALFTAALDTRIKSTISCSFYNERSKIAWPDWTWYCAEKLFCDAEVACLIYPRKLCIEVGKNDEVFNVEGARKEIHRLKKMCSEVGLEWLNYMEFDGAHEFCLEDEPLKRLAEDIREKK